MNTSKLSSNPEIRIKTILDQFRDRAAHANIEWMDKYIQQANDCYNRILAERLAEEKGSKNLIENEKKNLAK